MQSITAITSLPRRLKGPLSGYDFLRRLIGRSNTAVYRLKSSGRADLFLKSEEAGPFQELLDEAHRLRWLREQGIPCPEVLALESEDGQNWLLTTALPGDDMASAAEVDPEILVLLAADGLRMLHALDIHSCPFDQRLDSKIAMARARMVARAVDEADFDEERKGLTSEDLFRELIERRPDSEDLVVTHGDACLPNLIQDHGRFTGFVDCAMLGVADRCQDLALASRSIRSNLGEPWAARFLKCYGSPTPEAEKLDYYRLLDEFF